MDGHVRVAYQDFNVDGTEVRIYECGSPPVNDDGDFEEHLLYARTFLTDSSKKNVFYEAYRAGSNKPFYTCKAPPTKEELAFQLSNSQQGQEIKIAAWVVLGAFVLYIFLR